MRKRRKVDCYFRTTTEKHYLIIIILRMKMRKRKKKKRIYFKILRSSFSDIIIKKSLL